MFDICVKIAKVLWSVLFWCIERKTKWTFPFATISWKFWQYNELCLFNNIGSIKIGPRGWKMTMLRKLTIMNIKFMKKYICDGCCEVSSVTFVVGYINHNFINNVIFHP
jgi:hypothetical protein